MSQPLPVKSQVQPFYSGQKISIFKRTKQTIQINGKQGFTVRPNSSTTTTYYMYRKTILKFHKSGMRKWCRTNFEERGELENAVKNQGSKKARFPFLYPEAMILLVSTIILACGPCRLSAQSQMFNQVKSDWLKIESDLFVHA